MERVIDTHHREDTFRLDHRAHFAFCFCYFNVLVCESRFDKMCTYIFVAVLLISLALKIVLTQCVHEFV